MAMKKDTVLTVDSKPVADMIDSFLEKYPGLRSYHIFLYAHVSDCTFAKIRKGKPVKQDTLDKVVKTINDLDSLGSIEEIRQELAVKGCFRGNKDGGYRSTAQAQDDNRKLQMELGGICIQYGLSKRDLMKLDQIKKYEKENVLDYLIDHHMTIKACEKVYNVSTAFDAVSAIKSMKGNHRDKSVTAVK